MTMKRRGRALLVAVCAVSAAACGRDETVAGTGSAGSAQAQREVKQPRSDNPAHPTMQVTGCVERNVDALLFCARQQCLRDGMLGIALNGRGQPKRLCVADPLCRADPHDASAAYKGARRARGGGCRVTVVSQCVPGP